uniref:Uncharacterized protein n=1 Tax=Cairina moschata TaxID=8855 RepID=A0A8C3BUL7_CAIMO
MAPNQPPRPPLWCSGSSVQHPRHTPRLAPRIRGSGHRCHGCPASVPPTPGCRSSGCPSPRRSVSLKGLSPDDIDSSTEQLEGLGRRRWDPRRAPLIHSTESLLSLDEEDEADLQRAQEDARRLQGYGARSAGGCALAKSASLSVIDSFPPAVEISPFASQQSLANGFGAGSCGQLAASGEPGSREGSPLGRTLSFIRRMTGKTKSKEKEKMKEGKEKDARYTNGHLFTTITVSGMTMCFACNKSITAKEALICPSECPGARPGLRGSGGRGTPPVAPSPAVGARTGSCGLGCAPAVAAAPSVPQDGAGCRLGGYFGAARSWRGG